LRKCFQLVDSYFSYLYVVGIKDVVALQENIKKTTTKNQQSSREIRGVKQCYLRKLKLTPWPPLFEKRGGYR